MKNLLTVFLLILINSIIFTQIKAVDYQNLGTLIRAEVLSSPFPHLQRKDGYLYKDKKFPAELHYNDNSVIIFVPKSFTGSNREVNYVFYFHGWFNNIDSTIKQFALPEQFSETKKDAILIIVQGPKNAPDSFGGKLEDRDGFKKYVTEISDILLKNNIIKTKKIGKIVLSGHSGAYRVISFILNRGGMTEKIKEVYLFDALYGQLEKYTFWLNKYKSRFIIIYTEDGGTKEETELLKEDLKDWQVPFFATFESEVTIDELKDFKIIFLYSKLGHNDVISVNKNFYKFILTSEL